MHDTIPSRKQLFVLDHFGKALFQQKNGNSMQIEKVRTFLLGTCFEIVHLIKKNQHFSSVASITLDLHLFLLESVFSKMKSLQSKIKTAYPTES